MKRSGFVLADSVVAIVLMGMVVSFFCLNEVQLQAEMHHAKQELQLARLAKEATDAEINAHHSISYSQDGLQVTATQERVTITQRGRRVFTVAKD